MLGFVVWTFYPNVLLAGYAAVTDTCEHIKLYVGVNASEARILLGH